MCGKSSLPPFRKRDRPCTTSSSAAARSSTAPARRRSPGDVAIDGDRIVQVGGKAGPGKREVNADGRLVTPGWVDVHTHYDGQATWDPVLAPSSWHGATTIVFGNCGVGFAPVRREHQKALIDLMEGVEDIPGIALTEGLKWDWESFPEYLDALARLPRTIDIARPGRPPPAARLCHGRARDQPRARDGRGHRGDGAADRGGAAGRRRRLHHQPHRPAQDAGRRPGARPLCRARGADRHRQGDGPRRPRHVRHAVRLRGRGRRVRLDAPGGARTAAGRSGSC